MVAAPFRTYARVSLDRIALNYRNLRELAGPGVEVAAVVKAGAYGHGMVEVSRLLAAEGAGWLAVSSVEEGVTLREAGLGRPRILVMGGFLPYEADALIEFGLTPAVHGPDQIRQAESAARRRDTRLSLHLKIDSGMGRLGTRASAAQILAAVAGSPHTAVEGLMTHFASPADYNSSQTGEQLAYFRSLAAELCAQGLNPPYLHAASTAAIAYGRRESWFNMVRAGLLLYGYVPRASGNAPPWELTVEPALEWKAKLVAVKDIPEGAQVGYGGTFRAPRGMRIGVIGAGYADGVFHRLSNCGRVIAGGRLAPMVGAVSMDLTAIDLTAVDLNHTTALAPGDEVTLLGTEGPVGLNAQQIADAAGTIPYEVLCAIGARVRRVYA